jgi:hypothetical protein
MGFKEKKPFELTFAIYMIIRNKLYDKIDLEALVIDLVNGDKIGLVQDLIGRSSPLEKQHKEKIIISTINTLLKAADKNRKICETLCTKFDIDLE